jgi:hypothetical protein
MRPPEDREHSGGGDEEVQQESDRDRRDRSEVPTRGSGPHAALATGGRPAMGSRLTSMTNAGDSI